MKFEKYIHPSETILARFDYEFKGFLRKTLVITDKRNFCYKKIRHEEQFVSSQKAISHLEYGTWRVPWYAWLTMLIDLSISTSSLIKNFDIYSILSIIPSLILFIIAIIFRKFEFLITAVGSSPFHVISRKKPIVEDIKYFLQKLHTIDQVGLNASEKYVDGRYFDKFINRFLIFITFETSILVSILLDIIFVP